MRLELLAPVIVLLWLLAPMWALAEGSPVPAASQERIIADLTIRAVPLGMAEGHCIYLDAGHLTVSVQLVGEGPSRPVSYSFYGYRGLDRDASIEASVSRASGSFSVLLTGGLYCYALRNEEPIPPDAGMAQITNLGQDVSMRMIWAPVAR